MFLVTRVVMLRERTSGTLERLLSRPIRKLDLLFGYGFAFAPVAVVQAVISASVVYLLPDLHVQGPFWTVLIIVSATAVLGSATGLLISAFTRTEFQAMQFAPAVVIPQLLLCGLIRPRAEMAGALQAVSVVIPVRYAADALADVGLYPLPTDAMWRNLAVVVGFAVVMIVLGAVTLRRRTD